MLLAAGVAAAIRRIEGRVRSRFPKIRRIYIEAVPERPAPTATPGDDHVKR